MAATAKAARRARGRATLAGSLVACTLHALLWRLREPAWASLLAASAAPTEQSRAGPRAVEAEGGPEPRSQGRAAIVGLALLLLLLVIAAAAAALARRRAGGGRVRSTKALWTHDANDTPKQLRHPSGHAGAVTAVAVSPDGGRALTAGRDLTAIVWDLRQNSASPAARELLRFRGHADGARSALQPAVCGAAFFPDNARVVTAGDDRSAAVWNVATGQEILRFRDHSDLPVLAAAVFPAGDKVLTGGADRSAIVWHPVFGDVLQRFREHKGKVSAVAVFPDGDRALTAGDDGAAYVWSAASGAVIAQFAAGAEIKAAAVFPGGGRVLTAGHDRCAVIWSATSGQELVRFTGHQDAVLCAAVFPAGDAVVTAGADRQALVWDAATGATLARLAHGDRVLSVAVLPSGDGVLTGAADNEVVLWTPARA